MANPHRGQAALSVGGTAYTLCFSVNALCSLEDAADRSVNEIMAALADGKKVRMTTIRLLVWAGLLEHHPDITLKQAGQIITDGGAEAVMARVTEAINLAFPAGEAKSDEARP